MKEELKNIIKEKIIYHADETKYRYEIGKAVMDNLADDIVNALQTYNLSQNKGERINDKRRNSNTRNDNRT